MLKRWWPAHPLDEYDQWKLLEIAESANPPNANFEWYGDVKLPAKDGWKVTFYYDCGELDYIDSFVTPDGVTLNVFGPDVVVGLEWPPLMIWREVGDLKRLLKECQKLYTPK